MRKIQGLCAGGKDRLRRERDTQAHLPARGDAGVHSVAHFHEAGFRQRMRAVFGNEAGASEWRAVYAGGEVFPNPEVRGGLDDERDAGAVERASEEEPEAFAFGVKMEAAIRLGGSWLRREETEGELRGVVVAVVVMIAGGQSAGDAAGGGPCGEGEAGAADDGADAGGLEL